MKLKESLSPRHAPEKIVWTEADPFKSSAPVIEGQSLANAKALLLEIFRSGEATQCVCCGQHVKRYARSIHGSMVAALKYIAEHPGCSSAQVLKRQSGGDYAKLVHWGLLEQNDSGKWFATLYGRRFLKDEVTVAKYVYLYNATAFGRSEDQVSVTDCAGKDFSFVEIMDTAEEVVAA